MGGVARVDTPSILQRCENSTGRHHETGESLSTDLARSVRPLGVTANGVALGSEKPMGGSGQETAG